MRIECAKCLKLIEVPRWRLNRYNRRSPNKNFYCSREHYLTGRIWASGKNHPRWTGGLEKRVCRFCSKEFGAKRTLSTRFCSNRCWGKWWKKQHAKFPKRRKRSNPLRSGKRYQEWRMVVMRKSDKCVMCGAKEILLAHHPLSIKSFPGLVFDIDNGIVLCIQCHDKVHYSK